MRKRKPSIRQADIVVQFAGRLRDLRLSQGMTQAELATKAKVAVSYVWKLESGGASPGIDLLERLAVALGVRAHDLLPQLHMPDPIPMLRDRAKRLFDVLLEAGDRPTLTMLCALLARLGESPTRKR